MTEAVKKRALCRTCRGTYALDAHGNIEFHRDHQGPGGNKRCMGARKPPYVPDELVRRAIAAYEDCVLKGGNLTELVARDVLAAVLPTFEANLRTEIAHNIRETIDADVPGPYEEALEHAARIAEGTD